MGRILFVVCVSMLVLLEFVYIVIGLRKKKIQMNIVQIGGIVICEIGFACVAISYWLDNILTAASYAVIGGVIITNIGNLIFIRKSNKFHKIGKIQ